MSRIFTEKEQQQIRQQPGRAAGCWAVKEAVAKVFGTGFSEGIAPAQIEVLRDDSGRPFVNLYGTAREYAHSRGIEQIHVSISHTGDLVSAVAIGEGRGRDEISG